jgi:uncharacterized protein (UPF0332 family)
MLDAARAALLAAAKEPPKSEAIKTHSGLIAAFSLHLIKAGRIPTPFGKSLRQADQIRLIADYSDQDPDRETALSGRTHGRASDAWHLLSPHGGGHLVEFQVGVLCAL